MDVTRQSDEERAWWKAAVGYEIYPRSFADSDGDGVGDLGGVIEKVDYLAELGIDFVWLTPVYDSPLADFGYDIRDYHRILDEFGSMQDWEALRDRLHDRGMRLIMDLVVNHTSDEHDWFAKSRRSVDPYTDYYFWREGKDGKPPNNWESIFGGQAWTYDELRGEYYLHLFDRKQPDLDWANPTVREDVYEIMRWWLEKEVDGFRMDVINFISKPPELPDGDAATAVTGSEQFINGPDLETYLRHIEANVLSEYDVLTVGEMPGASIDEAKRFAGVNGPLDMIFHFEHMGLDSAENEDDPWGVADWTLADLKETVTRWQHALYPDGWNALYLGNHDQPRQVSRFGNDETYREESATLLGTLLHTLRGTPFIYQGDEIGMTNVPFTSTEELQDVETIRYLDEMLQRDGIDEFADVSEAIRYRSRDNARTPMQWSADDHAGFSTTEPWIKVNPNYTEINVADERGDPDSILQFYRVLIDLRHAHPVLVHGKFHLIAEDHPAIFAYERVTDESRALIVLNLSSDQVTFDPFTHIGMHEDARMLISNYHDNRSIAESHWEPYESAVYLLA